MLALLVGMIVVGYLIFLYVPALAVFIQRFGDAAESGDVTLGRTAFWTLAIEEFKKSIREDGMHTIYMFKFCVKQELSVLVFI